MDKRNSSYIVLIFGVIALSTSAVFAKLAKAPSSIIAFYRLVFSSIALLPVLLSKKNLMDEIKSLSRKQVYLGITSGIFLALHYVLWFESLKYTSVASSTVIVTLQPLFSVAGGYMIFGDKINRKSMLGIIIAIVGSIIIGMGDFQIGPKAFIGDIMALLAAAIITAYFLVGQHLRKKLSVIPYSLMGYISSSIFLFIYSLMTGVSFTGYDKNTWLMFLGLALISTILGQMLLNWVIKWLNTTIVSVGILGESIWAIIFSYIFLKETISVQQGLGISIILIGLGVFAVNNNIEKESIEEAIEA
ncbi:MAG: DMT family transporter [Firmicutes bacterium]|jgi:drug/metabolite transporter (DMT)-like permease|nr:DMT family transporter [Bacillota bacterium]